MCLFLGRKKGVGGVYSYLLQVTRIGLNDFVTQYNQNVAHMLRFAIIFEGLKIICTVTNGPLRHDTTPTNVNGHAAVHTLDPHPF